jgi:hypothetical protein
VKKSASPAPGMASIYREIAVNQRRCVFIPVNWHIDINPKQIPSSMLVPILFKHGLTLPFDIFIDMAVKRAEGLYDFRAYHISFDPVLECWWSNDLCPTFPRILRITRP